MGRTSLFDREALAVLLKEQHGVVARSQVRSCAMTEAALWHRIRHEGPWQVLLPGVYLSYTGAATAAQREIDFLHFVPPARAVADTALSLREVGEVRAVVAGRGTGRGLSAVPPGAGGSR
jgi:hypothetical protein